jgi:cytoskeleton protein RodZ
MSNESQIGNVEESELTSILRSESIVESVPTAGTLLEVARKERGWTIQQVSEQLKFSQSQIAALESNQYQALPTLVIVRGFVRAYAKLLKIDPAPIISLLPIESQKVQLDDSLKPALSTPFIESKMSLLGRSDTNRRYIVGAIILVVLAALFLISQTDQVKNFIGPVFSSSQQNVQIKNDVHKFSDELIEAVKVPSPLLLVKEVEQVSTPNGVVIDSKNIDESMKTTLPITTKIEQKPIIETKVQEVKDKNSLLLKFRENSWVQIKTEKGIILFERLMQAGTEETIKVDQALQVKIGNAAGVDGWLRGESLSIAPIGGSNVVNLSLK